VLILSDSDKPYELVCDACEVPPAVGAVLMQAGRPVAYCSRKLSGPELTSSVLDKEMHAVISALKELRCYLDKNCPSLLSLIMNQMSIWTKLLVHILSNDELVG
jgi:hypothetical protein